MEGRFAGCLLGLALGDALGAPYEGGLLGQVVWRVVGGRAGGVYHWTDDTQMTLVLARSLAERRDLIADEVATAWAHAAEWKRGYGSGAWRLLRAIRGGQDWREANRSIFPSGSWGNGAAMRAAPLGLFYHTEPAELRRATELAGSITHAHPLGMEGGVLIARAVALAVTGRLEDAGSIEELRAGCEHEEFGDRLAWVRDHLSGDASPGEVRRRLGNGIRAHESAVTAVYAACRFPSNFTGMMDFVVRLGGDTDTIGAMAGGIFGARWGREALPAEDLSRLEAADEIAETGLALLRAWGSRRCGHGPAGSA